MDLNFYAPTHRGRPAPRYSNEKELASMLLPEANIKTGWCLILYSIVNNWYQPKRITGFKDIAIPVTKSNKYFWPDTPDAGPPELTVITCWSTAPTQKVI